MEGSSPNRGATNPDTQATVIENVQPAPGKADKAPYTAFQLLQNAFLFRKSERKRIPKGVLFTIYLLIIVSILLTLPIVVPLMTDKTINVLELPFMVICLSPLLIFILSIIGAALSSCFLGVTLNASEVSLFLSSFAPLSITTFASLIRYAYIFYYIDFIIRIAVIYYISLCYARRLRKINLCLKLFYYLILFALVFNPPAYTVKNIFIGVPYYEFHMFEEGG